MNFPDCTFFPVLLQKFAERSRDRTETANEPSIPSNHTKESLKTLPIGWVRKVSYGFQVTLVDGNFSIFNDEPQKFDSFLDERALRKLQLKTVFH